MKENKAIKTYYYQDELNDDFANNNIKTSKISDSYKYKTRNPISIFFKTIVYYLLKPIVLLIVKLYLRPEIKNKKVLKKVRGKGYYVYSNHVMHLDPMVSATCLEYWKKANIIAGPDAFSIHPIVTWLVKCLGGMPIPNQDSMDMYKNYTDFMTYEVVKKKHSVIIYPEAHIWPYYNGIRHFRHSSFRYPVIDNSPILVMTTTWKERKNKKPKPVIYIDGPYYSDNELPGLKEKIDSLAETAYEVMSSRASTPNNFAYINYVKKDESNI